MHLSRDGAVVSPHTSVHPCRCGPLLQLCRGPLLRHTGLIVALRILTVGLDVGQRRGGHLSIQTPLISSPPHPRQSSAAFWRGAGSRQSLQRIAAVAFPSAQDLAAWQQAQDEAALRDHRRIGRVSLTWR